MPIVTIEPSRGWVPLRLRELWEYRELAYFLVWRDIKIRYKQTVLGAAWAIIQPILTMVVFAVFFGRLAKMPSDGVPYPIFAYAALVPWTFFAHALTQASSSLVGSANLIKKVYFPRLVMPIAAALSGILDFALAFGVLLIMMAGYNVGFTLRLLSVPLFVLLAVTTALGVALWLSALNVEYRDVRHAVPFLSQFWLFATPVAYPSSLLAEPWRTIYAHQSHGGGRRGLPLGSTEHRLRARADARGVKPGVCRARRRRSVQFPAARANLRRPGLTELLLCLVPRPAPGGNGVSDIAIRAENLSKQFRIGASQPRYRTLREHISNVVSLRRRRERAAADTIWALKDVSFEVATGEAIGIIGPNGAGKSTLLKILSRITEPTAGRAELHGRVGSLLEVGTGFHLELTGRENLYLNGAILGMRKADIDRKADEIVAFAETGKLIDTPVKHYSSGMYMRLAFAVAAHLEPEILIVDEVLAVGDLNFQNKCLGKMQDVARQGRTVLFVSHNMGAITNLCTSALWLDAGRIVAQGAVNETVAAYIQSVGRCVSERRVGLEAQGLGRSIFHGSPGARR